MKKQEKRCEKCSLPLSAFASISSHPPVVLSTCTPSFSPTPAFSCADLKLEASLPPSSPHPPHLHPRLTLTLPFSSLIHIFIPLPSLTNHALIPTPERKAFRPTKKTPHRSICCLCASLCLNLFFCNWIISLAANPTSVVFGGFYPFKVTSSHLFESTHFAVYKKNLSGLELYLFPGVLLDPLNRAHSKEYLLFLVYPVRV